MKAAAAVAGVVLSAALAGMPGIAGAADEGTVYLWVDKNGTPHYQDRPPEGTEASASTQELNLRYKLTDGQAVAAASKQKAELSDAAKLREKQQAEDKRPMEGAEDKADDRTRTRWPASASRAASKPRKDCRSTRPPTGSTSRGRTDSVPI